MEYGSLLEPEIELKKGPDFNKIQGDQEVTQPKIFSANLYLVYNM